ncbi:ABC transporter permease [Tistrella bauzanensis]|uniref:ABC transporter permease n=1 Tax=Tistrella bauzanensis TaxID=657419 RepID=A0ABQ1I889_9PROT|nr:ABC transporter permease [Tistrella bauzanensis]GGB25240.1 ABC transporter permease [Tistrella bauzanensis]
MPRTLLIRLLRTLATVLICISLTFIVLRLSGDPLDALLPEDAPQSIRDAYATRLGLDRPIGEQYVRYVLSVFEGDFGRSMLDGRDALGVVAERLPATLLLGGTAFALALLIGVPAGTVAALRRDSTTDRGVMGAAVIGYAMPNFFLGLVLIIIFALWLRVLPSSGHGTAAHLVLPALTLGTAMAGKLARFVRGAVLDVLGQLHIRVARGKRLPPLRILTAHIAPNAAVPVITFLGFELGLIVGGGVVVESVFGWPGVGRLLVQSVAARDLAVVQTIILMIALAMITANLLADIVHARLDPRVR